MFGNKVIAACLAAVLAGGVAAQNNPQGNGTPRLEARIAALSAAAEANPFELGMLTTLRAVEKVVQARYEYGIDNRTLGLPLLRLPMGAPRVTPAREATPETFREVVETFVADMSAARRLVKQAEAAGAEPFELTVTELWFDMNLNGMQDDGEGVEEVLAPVIFGRQGMRDWKASGHYGQAITVRFDAADQAWLAAYTHMLSGLGHAAMAFDPTPIFENVAEGRRKMSEAPDIPNIYDPEEIAAEIAALEAEQDRLEAVQKEAQDKTRKRDKELRDQINDINAQLRTRDVKNDQAKRDELEARRAELKAEQQKLWADRRVHSQNLRTIRNEISSAKAKLPLNDVTQDLQARVDKLNADYRAATKTFREAEQHVQGITDRQIALREALEVEQSTDSRAAIQTELAKLKQALKEAVSEKNTAQQSMRDIGKQKSKAEMELRLRTGTRSTPQDFRPIIDALYILITALEQQPEPAHVQAALDNWRSMISENRRFWTLLDQETDNTREWIPNARQDAALPLTIEPRVAEAWQKILDDAEDVLEGRLLIPHPLLPLGHGVSLTHYENNPTPLDLLGLIQGAALYEHVARGPRITAQSWRQFQRLTNGRAAGFALFFN
ncbi:hypothetical protein [Marimonas arenosa]|uniref:Chromosome partition protein Smc n=1 Tax=Marimonas arenosa TaxID=1795305 RepID=A0AAE3WG71_9RHOB|nr:hypothetical protein [Marimonas arenosa]MDQ2092094.1 hypothetical protein [Marimonas arenosa]